MKATILSLLLLASFAAFGENAVSPRIDEQASHYADTLVNIVFTVRHADVFEDWLDSFRKDKNYSQEAMAKALVSIVERGAASTNKADLHMASTAINAIGYLMLTNTLPYLREWTLGKGQVASSSFDAYGQITGFDERYLELGMSAVKSNTLVKSYVLGEMKGLLFLDNRLANGQKLPQYYRLQEKTKLKMAQMVINYEEDVFESCMSGEELFSRCLNGYTNSLEHVRAQQRIYDFLMQRKEHILKMSACRIVGENRSLSDEEWYRRATNGCQSEIARVKALPENERLNMTAILNAKISAIEAAEVRAARREVWKQRFHLDTFLILPVLCIAFAVHLVLKKKTAYGKSSWWKTVEAFVIAFVMVAVVGVVSYFEQRREVQETAEETNPSATLGLETTCVVWQKGGYDKYRREKELADTAVLKFRVTNQLDSMIGQYESLKLARNQLLIDLALAESRMSNETVAAEMDLLGKQAAALREKVAENIRACEELHVCISNQEHTLVQLESARKLANQNYSNFIRRLEGASLPAADPPAGNE